MTTRILIGDVRKLLADMPDQSVHCIIFSPPYWALRSYLPGDHPDKSLEIGLEPTMAMHIAVIVEICRELRRVLRDDGTMWMNYGDSYATTPNGTAAADVEDDDRTFRDKPFSTIGGGIDRGSRANLAAQKKNSRMDSNDKPMATIERQYEKSRCGYSDNKGQIGADHGARVVAGGTIKAKDLLMLPARIAIALCDDGWYLRSEIIWAKPNPMPESIRDRPVSAHEKMFLFAKTGETTFWTHRTLPGVRSQPEPDYVWVDRKKSPTDPTRETSIEPENWRDQAMAGHKKRWMRVNLWRGHDYFYDGVAVRTAAIAPTNKEPDNWDMQVGAHGKVHKRGRDSGGYLPNRKPNGWATSEYYEGQFPRDPKERGLTPRHEGHINHTELDNTERGTANLRNVWTIATAPFPGAHFATFPPTLVEPCIKAGTSAAGVCPHCGAPWWRAVKATAPAPGKASGNAARKPGHGPSKTGRSVPWSPTVIDDVEWRPTCSCPVHKPVQATILDPFGGACTVAMVADRLQRSTIMCELNDAYGIIAEKRLTHDGGMFASVTVERSAPAKKRRTKR